MKLKRFIEMKEEIERKEEMEKMARAKCAEPEDQQGNPED